jgi:hypothetical protein
MRHLLLALLVAAVSGLAVTTAEAQYPYRGYGEPSYAPNYYPNYTPNYAPNYAPNYGYQVNNYYRGWSAGQYYSGADPHGEAVRRIMAAHSRYRYYTHPRALDNSPPSHADYFGWE